MNPELRVDGLFGDHAVLQCRKPLKITGIALPGHLVSGVFAGARAICRSDSAGGFRLEFPPLPPGGPHELNISLPEAGREKCFKDLYLGEVWVAGGQSNMEFPLGAAPEFPVNWKTEQRERQAVIRVAALPFRLGVKASVFSGAEWQTATNPDRRFWPMAAFHFARELRDRLRIPIGIVATAVGGTGASSWIMPETLRRLPDFAVLKLPRFTRTLREVPEGFRLPDSFRQHLRKGIEDDSGEWRRCRLPGARSACGIRHCGTVRFRLRLRLPGEWAGRPLKLHLGCIDKTDRCFFNGVEIGHSGDYPDCRYWNIPRCYRIDGEVGRAGENTLEVVNLCWAFDGGLTGPASKMYLVPVGGGKSERISLAGDAWEYRVDHDWGCGFNPTQLPPGTGNPATPGLFFWNRIRPLADFSIRGVIYYQGEADIADPERYRRLLPRIVADWRKLFREPELPFLQVLLAGFGRSRLCSPESGWAAIRQRQCEFANENRFPMASAIDLGAKDDLHPHRKREVGYRLAVAALRGVYRCAPGEGRGPRCVEISLEPGREILLRFQTDTGELCCSDGGVPTGFSVCCHGRIFRPAARMAGNCVRLSGRFPTGLAVVYYAWADRPVRLNLCDSAGIPAEPFHKEIMI